LWYNKKQFTKKECWKMYKLVVGIALAVLTYGCNTMTSPQSTFERGEVVNHGIFDDALVVAQVVSTNVVHAYSVSDAGFTYGLRIAILPLSDDYVNGQHIRRGYYEYLGPYTYVTIKDGKGNDEQTNTIRLFREIVQ